MASIASFERMLPFHVDQSLWSFWIQVGPCHQIPFPCSILTVELLDTMSIGFWSIETCQNSMPLFDWISFILFWKIAFRIFFDFNQCKKYCESVHKVFQWISNCKFCVMKLILLILMKAASSWSWDNDVSYNGAILGLMKRRLVLFDHFLGIIDRLLFPMPCWSQKLQSPYFQ